ncbi:MAG: hypothetical protein O9282_00970 [Flavobacterium sp.]|uniref:hypothetical protein n=1 Tax=Flavobacterium TaxID=237 RepID=UPI0022C1CDA2|nr:hypothetical protein [Flavobacterium sp.]MCZ8329861.1 hypothetical protein [Flavobacterium sp.]
MEKIKLFQIDIENWRFTLYESQSKELYASFPYSPRSFIDLEIFIKLTEEEKIKAKNDRNFLLEISDDVRNNYKNYFSRTINFGDFKLMR